MDISNSANLAKLDINTKIESFIKLNPTLSNTTNIQNLWIALPNSAKMIPFLDNLSKQENEVWQKNEADFMREDLVEPVMRILYPEGEYKKIINSLKPFISLKDVSALLFASDICNKENNKVIFDDNMARKKLVETHKRRGLTLYNWLRSEDVMPFDLLPFIESKDKYPDNNLFTTLFSVLWEQLIECHPSRIFVARDMDAEDLISEIIKRAIIKNSKKIVVYSRCSRNRLAKRILRKLVVSYKFGKKIKWKFKKKEYKIGFNPAMKIEITPELIDINKKRK